MQATKDYVLSESNSQEKHLILDNEAIAQLVTEKAKEIVKLQLDQFLSQVNPSLIFKTLS